MANDSSIGYEADIQDNGTFTIDVVQKGNEAFFCKDTHKNVIYTTNVVQTGNEAWSAKINKIMQYK
jgi:hypothetical protein